MEPDKLGLALSMVIQLLGLLPGAKSWLVVLESQAVMEQMNVVANSGGGLSLAYERLEVVVQEASVETVDTPAAVRQLETLLKTAGCIATLASTVTPKEERNLAELTVTVFGYLRGCTSLLKDFAGSSFLELLDTVGAVAGVLRSLADAIFAGLRSWAGQVDLTVGHEVADPLKDIDWLPHYPQACPFEDEGYGRHIDEVVRADVTGDEIADAVVIASCEQSAGRTVQQAWAFGGADGPVRSAR